MICPRCSQHQPDAPDCSRCGLVVAKWNPDSAPRSKAPAGQTDAGGRWLSLILGACVLAVASGGFFVWRLLENRNVHAVPPPSAAAEAQIQQEFADMKAAAKELGCPRRIKATDAIVQEAANDPLPAGWMLDAPGWSRVTGPDRAKDQPMLVYFGVPFCKYATAFERDTLADPAVRARLSGFARVRINPEAGETEKRVADDFGVMVYPTVYVVRPGDQRTRIDVLRDVDQQIMLGKPQDLIAALDALMAPPPDERTTR